MRWFSRDSEQGVSEVELTPGRYFLVPAVVRYEDSDSGLAFLTNEDWLREKPTKRKWPLEPGRHYYWLEVRAGSRIWRSPQQYEVFVPDKGRNNAHFTVSVHYGGLY